MGRNTRGVRGIRIGKDDRVVGMVAMEEPGSVLTVTERGYGKRSHSGAYRLTHRGSGGVINIRNIERNGKVISLMEVSQENELIMVSSNGMVIRLPVEQIREMRRNTMGVRLMNLPESDSLVDAAVVQAESEVTSPTEEKESSEDSESPQEHGTGD